ncbi:MAG: ATP-binding protein [Candidatus Woesearchaeota archaeon]|jgi:Lon-like ATP-dependent protease
MAVETKNEEKDSRSFKTTSDIKVDKSMINQVLGQHKAVEIIKKAAAQRRHVFLIGEPGTGKSMLGAAMAELLPKEKLKDIMCFKNPDDENTPLIRTTNVGEGRNIVARSKVSASGALKNQNIILLIIVIAATLLPYYFWKKGEISDVIYAASMISSMGFIVGFIIFMNVAKKMNVKIESPKVIVDNFGKNHAPFYDASGAHAGALLGDVLHDPFQSGGLGTPAHERVIAGMIHKAHMGYLLMKLRIFILPHSKNFLRQFRKNNILLLVNLNDLLAQW